MLAVRRLTYWMHCFQPDHSFIPLTGVLAQKIPWESALSGNVSYVQLTDTE